VKKFLAWERDSRAAANLTANFAAVRIETVRVERKFSRASIRLQAPDNHSSKMPITIPGKNHGEVLVPSRVRRSLLCFFVLALAAGLAPGLARADKKEKNLSPHYRQWLDRDVAYIIMRQEKSHFLKLATDEERDQFIEHFWRIRNPNPESPTNEYKEEHYRRLEYADEHFGIGKRVPGWSTERGRIYITLGPPKQKADYQGLSRVRPMQIWFYESPSPALPPFFYIVFYKKDSVGDYVSYSPYFQGPQELITERGMTNLNAIALIQRDAGEEVARTSLTLLPDEPADLKNPRPSMQSDVMLSQIHDLANNPYTVEELGRHAMMADVVSRLLVGGETLGFLTAPLRDVEGNVKLHYLLRLKRPEDFVIGKSAEGKYYFSIGARVQVYGPDEKLIFTQEQSVKHFVSPEQMDQVKNKLFGYEGWLPLAPGKYHLKFLFTNWVNSVGYQAETNATVPDMPSTGLTVTPLVPFTSVQSIQPDLSGLVPFSAAGLKFSPLLGRELNYSPATDLQFFYQVWAAHDELLKPGSPDLEARYAFGRLGAIGDARVIKEEVSKQQIDPTGTMLTGKKIPLGAWPQGNYLLTLTLNSTEGQEKASGTLSFRLLESPPSYSTWDVFDGDGIARDVRDGTVDYQRGLCYLAFGEKDGAAVWFRKALEKNPAQEGARSALVNLDFERKAFSDVAELAGKFPLTDRTDDETILRMAEALDKTGKTQEAIDLLQSAVKVKSPTGPFYLTLASYYRRVGDARKGDDFEKKGQALLQAARNSQAPLAHE
jgi:GWxTD domain-containing protein